MKITYELSELDSVAAKVLASAKSKILLFYGEMGVGKTTLIKQLAKQLGVKEMASSPTYSIVNEYRTYAGIVIYHFDFYRLEQPEEILDIGFEEYLEKGDWIFMEWPEKIRDYLPKERTEIDLIHENDRNRSLSMKKIC